MMTVSSVSREICQREEHYLQKEGDEQQSLSLCLSVSRF